MTLPALQVAQTRGGRLGYVVSGKGSPAIVLVNGAGMALEGWAALYPAIESLGAVFAYNRPGIMGSDPPQQAETGAAIVAALRELLGYAGVEAPYVVVGHSLGCLHADLFARLHPQDVAALLLIEPTPLDDPQALREHAMRFVQGTSKALSLPQPLLQDNLYSELAALEETLHQLESAGDAPAIPREVLHAQGHFPQLSDPQAVLDAIALVTAAAARSIRR